MKKNTLLISLMLLFMTTLSPVVAALALADLELKSSLNQQLDVRIRLLTSAPDELDSLTVHVKALSHAGTGHLASPQLLYELIREESGNYLRITTRDAVREPVISFLVEMNWSGGHFLREYSLLIDPQN
jgi:pilus assembly protein FimV